ncbi:hypothetical protein PF008_g28901 [Phytophthora fragariae]|uniref:Secreted protein n=1 Tax=Phytophthora fragariae TaxID=53985 RepID=A0A6G0QAS6_9STRA|nr:hypothetical protein PF008_g28901 [Phytophthora fragariae]
MNDTNQNSMLLQVFCVVVLTRTATQLRNGHRWTASLPFLTGLKSQLAAQHQDARATEKIYSIRCTADTSAVIV